MKYKVVLFDVGGVLLLSPMALWKDFEIKHDLVSGSIIKIITSEEVKKLFYLSERGEITAPDSENLFTFFYNKKYETQRQLFPFYLIRRLFTIVSISCDRRSAFDGNTRLYCNNFYKDRTRLQATLPKAVIEKLEKLKKDARSQGLWNLLITSHLDHKNEFGGAGLSTLEYDPICELMGRSMFAPEVFICKLFPGYCPHGTEININNDDDNKLDVRLDIARSRIEIEQARLLVLKAAREIDFYGPKTAAAEIAMINVCAKFVDRAIQLFGAAGMNSADWPLANFYAAPRALRLADGPDIVYEETVARAEFQRAHI